MKSRNDEAMVELKEDSDVRKPLPFDNRSKNTSTQSISVKESIEAVNDAVSTIEGLTIANRRPIRRLQKAAAPTNNTVTLNPTFGLKAAPMRGAP